ncbi:MAG: hypothetical protein MR210_07550 [Erysipelotrichaceae bacterium]|nr:hypothetical protein [Erysipelotrichaceae bacterium]MDY5251186.1 hypothetical protein [Erysipelotrichaceae bacterium]
MVRKLLLSLIMTIFLVSSIYTVRAEDSPPPTEVVVEEEQTPEAAPPQEKSNYLLIGIMVAMGIFLVGGAYKSYMEKNKKIKLSITGIDPNGDGSYMVRWGCDNPTKKNITPHKFELNVTKGSAILLKQKEDKEIKPGKTEDVMVTVVNQDSLLEWVVDDQKLVLDGKDLENRKGEIL